MTEWHEDTGNADLLTRLRSVVGGQGRLLVFLGAGLSFGAARLRSRATFDYDRYDRWLLTIPSNDGVEVAAAAANLMIAEGFESVSLAQESSVGSPAQSDDPWGSVPPPLDDEPPF